MRWTPIFGPVGKLWICGSDRQQNDQTNENKTKPEETQRELQSEGRNGSDDGHQDSGADREGVWGAPCSGEPVEVLRT